MAQFQTSFPQNRNNPPPYNTLGEHRNQQFIVVDQQPPRITNETFPLNLPLKWILGFSITKCVLASIMVIMGIVNLAVEAKYLTSYIAFPIWCGLTILANGIIGCILKVKQNKCLVGAFLALSITSLILSTIMLISYAVALDYFINLRYYNCGWYYDPYGSSNWQCRYFVPYDKQEVGSGLTGFLLFIIVFELACSIGSTVVSCKAYSKCCNSCDVNDCSTCLGCCECDTTPLYGQQMGQNSQLSYNNGSMQTAPHPQANQPYNPNQAYNAQVNIASSSTNAQQGAPTNQQAGTGLQSNACSGLMAFVVNIPAYIFGSGGENGIQPASFNVTIQPVRADHQGHPVQQI